MRRRRLGLGKATSLTSDKDKGSLHLYEKCLLCWKVGPVLDKSHGNARDCRALRPWQIVMKATPGSNV